MESPSHQDNFLVELPHDGSTEYCMTADVNPLTIANDEMVENSVIPGSSICVDGNLEPYVGMEFESEEAAKNFYNNYGKCVGFGIRTNMYYRSKKDLTIISRQFVCSKEGFRRKRDASDERIQLPRPNTREGCKAMIIIRKQKSGKWLVAKFEKNHNHALTSPNNLHCFRSHRCILNPKKKRRLINVLKEAGMDARDVIKALIEESGGIDSQSDLDYFKRYNNLYQEAIKCAEEGTVSGDVHKVALHALREAREKIVAAKRNVVLASQIGSLVGENNQDGAIPKGSQADGLMNQVTLQEPLCERTIGRPSKNTRHKEQPVRKSTRSACKGQLDKKLSFITGQCSSQDNNTVTLDQGISFIAAGQCSSQQSNTIMGQLDQAISFVAGPFNSQENYTQDIPQT